MNSARIDRKFAATIREAICVQGENKAFRFLVEQSWGGRLAGLDAKWFLRDYPDTDTLNLDAIAPTA